MTRLFILCLTVFMSSTQAYSVDLEALQAKRPPKLLSETGLFLDAANQVPAPGVHPYGLINELFTDYALKHRFVFIAKDQQATYRHSESLEFPIGSVLVKNFGYSNDLRNPDRDFKLIETRLLIHREDGWHAWAYIWKEDQSDAILKIAGGTLPISFTDANGIARDIRYVVPNKNQCKGCHIYNGKISPIGPKGRNMDRDFPYKHATMNQWDYWRDHDLIENATSTDDLSSMVNWKDENAPLDRRARAYLDINCAHCHRLEGPGSTSGLYLTYEEDNPITWGLGKRPVAAGRGSGGFDYDIDPGHAETSILYYRMFSNDPSVRMPEIGRTIQHAEGVALIKHWITSLDD